MGTINNSQKGRQMKMKKLISMLLVVCMMAFTLTACGGGGTQDTAGGAAGGADVADAGDAGDAANDAAQDLANDVQAADAGGHSVGFVTFGLGGDFFQMLADEFVKVMEEAGWEAQYADGEFNPETQIAACENYIAMGVDVLVVWAVAPEAMDGVIDQAMSQGIKVVSFVAETSKYDALMLAPDEVLADACVSLAAKWIDENYADAEDHSVPVAVFSCRVAETGVVQADEMLKIEEFSTKAKLVTEVENQAEDLQTGMSAAENLYTTNPEIKVFLTPHSGLGMGINNYFTGISSPVTDYTGMGIFCINGDNATAEAIQSAANGEAPLRGMVLTGSVNETAQEIRDVCVGLMDGSVASGSTKIAATTYVNEASVEEYLSTGTTSLTDADFQ